MARPPSVHPTDAELEILKVLWDAGPSELGKIATALNRGRAVATTTVATTLKVMLQKGSVGRSDGPRGHCLTFKEFVADLHTLAGEAGRWWPGTPSQQSTELSAKAVSRKSGVVLLTPAASSTWADTVSVKSAV